MKKTVLLFGFLFLCSPVWALFGFVTKDQVTNELNALKVENNGEMNAVKLQAGQDINALKLQVQRLSVKLDANIQGVAGFNNDLKKMSAGHDLNANTTTTNDTGLMKKIIAGLCTVIGGILTLFSTIVTLLIKKIFALMNNIIDETQNSKNEYKSVVMQSVKPTQAPVAGPESGKEEE